MLRLPGNLTYILSLKIPSLNEPGSMVFIGLSDNILERYQQGKYQLKRTLTRLLHVSRTSDNNPLENKPSRT